MNYEDKRFKFSEPVDITFSSDVSVQLSFFFFKVDILLKAVGDTPIMKTKKWAVERTRTIQGLIDFIKKFLKLVASEQLFIYVNQSFAPSPDQEVGTLYECFGSDGKLVLHYCKSQAWGWATNEQLDIFTEEKTSEKFRCCGKRLTDYQIFSMNLLWLVFVCKKTS